eukprot:714121_1
MDRCVKNEEFLGLIMHRVDGGRGKKVSDSCDNLFKKELLELFRNTNEIIIYSTYAVYGSVYPLNILKLLKIISSSKGIFNKIIIKDSLRRWLFIYFSEFERSIKQKYNEKKLSVELKRKQG